VAAVTVGRFEIPEDELEWRFSTSGGPGGQHANRSNTRVELRFDLGGSDVFPDDVQRRMLDRLEHRLVSGEVIVVVDESRSQYRNRAIARRRLAALLAEAMVPPVRRKKTKPTRASKDRRAEEKRHRSETKKLRRKPELP